MDTIQKSDTYQTSLDPELSAEEFLAIADRCLRAGDYLKAFDTSQQALSSYSGHRELRHRAVLSLARMGAVERAEKLFVSLGLDAEADEDIISLKARLLKDSGLRAAGAVRLRALQSAREAYEKAFSINAGFYPAINVATIAALSGDDAARVLWARRCLDRTKPSLHDDSYYVFATRAEAFLLLGEYTAATEAINTAAALSQNDAALRGNTYRQLRRVCEALKIDIEVIAALKPPLVLHYCGHIIAAGKKQGRFAAHELAGVQRRIEAFLDEHRIDFAVGSLAAGADILVAEAVLNRGGRIGVVLPFSEAEFVDVSVRPSGEDWASRFASCLNRANYVRFVTEDAWLGDDELFGLTTEFAVGLAILRAQWLSSEVVQLAVWDGDVGPPPLPKAGTAHDVMLGEKLGIRQHIIPVRGNAHAHRTVAPTMPGRSRVSTTNRVGRAMIFGDFKGFSKLTDSEIPQFIGTVLGDCAKVLETYTDHLCFVNTWGDGIYLVFDEITEAACCAFALQKTVSALDLSSAGLPQSLGLRLGFHYGPVYEAHDPILGKRNYFGFHVSRTARIEPITPEGDVYITEQTAAALAVAAPGHYVSNYVGRVPLAKGYGELPMYLLTVSQEQGNHHQRSTHQNSWSKYPTNGLPDP
ncbi:MAG: adenylate cyclase [Spirochaetaceae bacterium]|nr:MAG: adenylate cyclase [Spirochaetaceae bacterium]